MVQVEWRQILEISPESLTEQRKEELYDDLAWFDPEPESDPGHLKHLISILAEILKFKGEQVDSLTVEIDSLAAKQGQEEARQHQLQSVEQLYSGNTTDVENLRKELIQIELQNEKLLASVQEKDEQILEDQNQIKKLSDSVLILEREKVELQRELTSLQQEIIDQQESKTNNTESTDNCQELMEAISQKNKHISQLLVDVEVIERENTELRKTLTAAKDELSDATHHLESLSRENISLATTLHAKDEKIEELQMQIQGLRNQVDDLIDDKTRRDQELEELAKALDTRVQLWKEKIDAKNEKIEELKQKLDTFGNVDSYPNVKVAEEAHHDHSELLNALLKKRELQIEMLQNQLTQATQDLNETTALLERKDNVFSKTKTFESPELKQKLAEAQEEIESLQKRIIEAEEDARSKAEETAEMILQLREYEAGTFGLEDAMRQINELKKLKQLRELRIEELIQAGNELGNELNQIELENLELRSRLGLSEGEVVNVEGVVARQREEKKELNLLKKQLETQENLTVDLKLERHELLKKINLLLKQQPDQTIFQPPDDKALKPYQTVVDEEAHILENKLKEVIEENDALRKGMHEILDSIKDAEFSSDVIRIESNCLERLLEALDSRHVNGWYHPAMRLQAQLFVLQGMNSTLREELKHARVQQEQASEKPLSQSRPPTSSGPYNSSSTGTEIPSGPYSGVNTGDQMDSYIENHMEESQQLADSLKQELRILTQKLAEEQDTNQSMSSELNALKSKLLEIKEQTIIVDDEYEAEKLGWQKVREAMGIEIERLNCDLQDKQVLLEEHETNWKQILNDNPDELKVHLTHLNTKLVNILNEKCQLTRKVNILLDNKNKAQSRVDELEDQMTNTKEELTRMAAQHDRVKEQFTSELESLRQMYEDCISAEEVANLKQDMYELTIKYRTTLQSISDVLGQDSRNIDTQWTSGNTHQSTPIRQLEEKCHQFEKKLAVMVESEKSLQKFQTQLSDTYAESVTRVEHQNVLNKLRDSERQVAKLKTESANFIEMLNEAHAKMKQIELRKAYHEFEHDALQRCILELQCISDDKSTIGRLTQEIHSLHVNEIKNQDALQAVQHELTMSQKTNQELQNSVQSLRHELALQKQIFNDKIRQLKTLILCLNRRFVGALPLLSEEIWSNQVRRIMEEKLQLMKCSGRQMDEREIQTASLDNLRVQLKTLNFAKTSMDKRLEVAEEVISKYEALVNSLQTDMINMESKYEKLLMEAHNVEEKLDKFTKKDEILIKIERDEVTPTPKEKEAVQKSDEPDAHKSDDEHLSSTIDKLQEELREKMKNVEDKNEIIEKYNVEMRKLNEKINELHGKLSAKEEQLKSKTEDLESFKMAIRNRSVSETNREDESSEKKAYKVTVASLENIITQKEITIKNYQSLLEKTKEQNVQAMLDLQNKCSNLQTLLQSKEKTDSRSKLDSKADLEGQSDMRPIMNTYLTRIHELEDNLTQVSNELATIKQQGEHWYHIASERLKVVTDLQLKLESYKRTEDDDGELLAQFQQKDEQIEKLQNIIEEYKSKPTDFNVSANSEKNDTNKSRLKNEIETYKRKLDAMANHEKELKKEIQKLKDQISHLKPISGKNREELLSAKEEMYTKKIKQLKEEIEDYRKREEKDKILRKMKCEEEVEKWSEKKQWQNTTEKLKQQLKDKTTQYDALRITHDRLKETVIKMERERFMLESKLKIKESQLAAQGHGVVENLEREIRRLEEELNFSRRENEVSSISKSNRDLIEHLRRKIFVYENAQKGDRKLAEELENAIERKTLSQKRNLKLEAENNQLKEELEKLRQGSFRQALEMAEINPMSIDIDSLTEEEGSSDKIQIKSKQRRTADLEKAVTVLKRVVDKLQAENKRLSNKQATSMQEKEYTEKIQMELQKSQANYLDSVEKCSLLEAELMQLRTYTNRTDRDEIERLNSQLAQKSALLSRVKLLLERAAARERSLTEQIKFLQTSG